MYLHVFLIYRIKIFLKLLLFKYIIYINIYKFYYKMNQRWNIIEIKTLLLE